MALALHKYTPNSNALGMADLVTPTSVGGKKLSLRKAGMNNSWIITRE